MINDVLTGCVNRMYSLCIPYRICDADRMDILKTPACGGLFLNTNTSCRLFLSIGCHGNSCFVWCGVSVGYGMFNSWDYLRRDPICRQETEACKPDSRERH